MSVNHFLLPISDTERAALRTDPESCPDFVDSRASEVETLHTAGNAITSLIAESADDELAFIQEGAPDEYSEWIGEYTNSVCQVDMGYGPAWCCDSEYVARIAAKIKDFTETDFAKIYDPEWLEENRIYPSGWCDEDRAEFMIEQFNALRNCVMTAAEKEDHLLIWCA